MLLLYIVYAFNMCAVTRTGLGRNKSDLMPVSGFMSNARDICHLGFTTLALWLLYMRQKGGVNKRRGARVYLVSS